MTIVHYVLLALIFAPIAFFAYRITKPVAAKRPRTTAVADLTNLAFATRISVVLLAYGVLYGVGGGSVPFVLGQAAVPVGATAILFAAVYLVAKLVGRVIEAPRRKFFGMSLFLLVLFAAAALVNMKAAQIHAG